MISLSIFTSVLFWFMMFISFIGLITVLINKQKQNTNVEFLNWLKTHLEKVDFPTVFPNKQYLESYIHTRVTGDWVFQYIIETGNTFSSDNISEITSEIIKLLTSKKKITYRKSTQI